MKNTSKHAGVVAAVLTAAGITGACPGMAFADSSAGQVPTTGSTAGAPVVHDLDSNHRGDDLRPIVVHGPVLSGGPMDRGPGYRFYNDGGNRHFDNDGRDRHFDDDRGNRRFDDDGHGRRFDIDGRGRRFDVDRPIEVRPIVFRGPVRPVIGLRTEVSESQTGTVCSVSDGKIVVTGAFGATWTWVTDTTTRVRMVGGEGTLADLRAGDRILVSGLRHGTDRHAESVMALSRTEMVAAPRHTEMFVAVSQAEMFETGRHMQIHRQHERADHCEHEAGWHGHGKHCAGHRGEHHAPRGGEREGRHRL